MKDFMQSSSVEYKNDNKEKEPKEDNVENFADIQNSLNEQENLEN